MGRSLLLGPTARSQYTESRDCVSWGRTSMESSRAGHGRSPRQPHRASAFRVQSLWDALLQATKGDNVVSLQKGLTLKGAKRKACFTLKADSETLGGQGRKIDGPSDQPGLLCPVTGVDTSGCPQIERADGIQEVRSPLHSWRQGSSLDPNMVQQSQQPEVTSARPSDPSVQTHRDQGRGEYGQSRHLCWEGAGLPLVGSRGLQARESSPLGNEPSLSSWKSYLLIKDTSLIRIEHSVS